ncbi:hypothetical protein VTH06DRAFT_2425 [Thermothelomyces fergusii]
MWLVILFLPVGHALAVRSSKDMETRGDIYTNGGVQVGLVHPLSGPTLAPVEQHRGQTALEPLVANSMTRNLRQQLCPLSA